MRRLEGRAAIVTGAAQGIGYAIAARLRDEGCRVCILDVNEQKLREASRELGDCPWFMCDVSSVESIARAVSDSTSTLTKTSSVLGTAQYLSPEQARGETVDARSDLYSAGCVLYEMVTGAPPFTGESPVAVAYQHVRETPRPPSAVNPDVSRYVDAVIMQAMAKNPENRYASAGDMRTDLLTVLSGGRPSAPLVLSDDDLDADQRPDRNRGGDGCVWRRRLHGAR